MDTKSDEKKNSYQHAQNSCKKKHGTKEPVITVKTSKTNTYGHEVEILGESKVVYSPDKPLSCGARVWIETNAEVKIDGQNARTLSESPETFILHR